MPELFILYIITLLYFGLIKRQSNWFIWGMFAQASFWDTKIFVDSKLVNIWDYLPQTQIMFNKETLQSLLFYLRDKFHSQDINGLATFYSATTSQKYRIQNARLIPTTD